MELLHSIVFQNDCTAGRFVKVLDFFGEPFLDVQHVHVVPECPMPHPIESFLEIC